MNGLHQLRSGAVAATLWGVIISSPPRAECQVARATVVEGPQVNASILRLGGTNWTTLFPNTFIFSGDLLRVRHPTAVKIKLEGGNRKGDLFFSTELAAALPVMQFFVRRTSNSRAIAVADSARLVIREEDGALRVVQTAGALVVRLTSAVRGFSVVLFDRIRHVFSNTRVIFLVDAAQEQSVVFVESGTIEIPVFSTSLTAGDLLHTQQGRPFRYHVSDRFLRQLADVAKRATPDSNLFPKILGGTVGIGAAVGLVTFIASRMDGRATTGGIKVGYPRHR